MDVRGFAESQAGISAGEGVAGIDARAGRKAAHRIAGGQDFARGVGARGARKRKGGVGAGAQIGFDGIDPDGANANENLVVAGLRVGHLFQDHDLRAAKFVDADYFHY